MFCYSVTKIGNNNFEQRCAIKFCGKLREGATDTHERIQRAFRDDSRSRAEVLVFRWHKDFVNGRETVEDEPRSGRPASVNTTNVDRVKAYIRQDRCLAIRMIADELNINEGTVHQIVTQDLNMRKLCAKMVPEKLNDDQKARRNEVSAETRERLETEPDFLNRVIRGHESCCFFFFEYDPATIRQSKA
jgi:transposase